MSRGRYAAIHAATEAGEVACGTQPRKQVPTTEIGIDLSAVTCRTCCAELSTGDRGKDGHRTGQAAVRSAIIQIRPNADRAGRRFRPRLPG